MERIGYQGRPGSNNHAAARHFASKYGWTEAQLVPLVTGENLMAALNGGEVRFGVYAHSTAAGGIVAENEAAFGDRVLRGPGSPRACCSVFSLCFFLRDPFQLVA